MPRSEFEASQILALPLRVKICLLRSLGSLKVQAEQPQPNMWLSHVALPFMWIYDTL